MPALDRGVMTRISLWSLLLGLGLILISPATWAADWPQFRGLGGQGQAKATLPTTWDDSENIVWKVDLPAGGTSSPITVKVKIYLTGHTGFNGADDSPEPQLHLLCLNGKTGKLDWKTSVEPNLPDQERIREEHGYASATPCADDKRIYTFFGKSGVYAFDYTGKQLWHADVGDGLNGWGSAASPVLVGKLLIVNACVESESLVALDSATGKEVWRARGIKESWNTPIVVTLPGGKQEIVVAIFGKVLGFDPQNGKQLWSCDTDIGWYMVPSLVSENGIVYCVGGRGGGGCLAVKVGGRGEVTGTHRLWTVKKGSNVTSPLLHQGHLYWMNEAVGLAYCVDVKAGKLVYEQRVPGAEQTYGSPVLADGKIYYPSRFGKIFVVAAKPKFELLATNPIGHRTIINSSPAIFGNQLLIRADKTLYCLGEK